MLKKLLAGAILLICSPNLSFCMTPGYEGKEGAKITYDFRVLGRLEETCRLGNDGLSSWTTLNAQDAEHAKMTASKLLADLKGFGDIKTAEGPATSLALEGAGHWVVGLDGSKVQVLFAKDSVTLDKCIRDTGASHWQLVPEHAYPRWLDRFDNDAVSFGYMGWAKNRGDKDINESVKWIGTHHFGISAEIGSRLNPMVAPGLFDDSTVDYYAALAKKYDVPFDAYTFGYNPSRPEYLWNEFPLPHYLPSPGFKAFHVDPGTQRFAYQAGFMPGAVTDEAAASADMGFSSILAGSEFCNATQGTMEFGSSFPLLLSNIAGSPGVKKEWISFLKDVRHYSLEDVGRIYTGNPDSYKTWEEVPVTIMQDFTGWEPGKSLDLRGEWLGRPDLKKEGLGKNRFANDIPAEGWASLPHGATVGGYGITDVCARSTGNPFAYHEWAEIPIETMMQFTGWDAATCQELRGKHDKSKYGPEPTWFGKDLLSEENWTKIHQDDPRILAYSQGDFWLRRYFTIDANAMGPHRYLHVSRNAFHGKGPRPEIYVNGQPVKNLNTGSDSNPSNSDLCYDLQGALVPGKNLIAMRIAGGQPMNYIFLGAKGSWDYPSDDEKLNRQYFDMVEFASRLVAKNAETLIRARRAGDPEGRPQFVMAVNPIQDLLFDIQKRYGAYPHCTGQSGDCWAPWVTRYSATRGQPISSEVGSAPSNAADIQKQLTLYELLGDDAIHFLFHPTQYRNKPDIAEWIDSNMSLFHCAGKTDRPAPSLGILRSVRDASRLGFQAPWSWDISRGEAQAVGRSVDMVDPSDLVSGDASKWFKVLFDAGTELFTKEEITGLDHFVREGGTFIALHNTGRHTSDLKDSWPISDLTGLKVVSQNEFSGKIRFTDTQTLWPSLRGKELSGRGIALEWQHQKENTSSLGVEATPNDEEVIAEWVDKKPGEGRIAIATRRLGKGMIMTLGSSFWHNAQDIGGSWKPDAKYRPYLAELFDSLKVPYDSRRDLQDASNADVFAEHFLSKNGLYDLYMLSRVNDKAQPAKASVIYKAEHRPQWLREFSAKGHPDTPFSMESDGIKISDMDLGPMQLRIFAAPRHDIAQSTMTWLQSLHKRWYALEPLEKSEIPAPPKTSPYLFPLVKDWTLVSGSPAWAEPPADASYWTKGQPVKLGTYAALGLDETALAQFHKSIRIPDSWAGHRIFLKFSGDPVIGGIHYKNRLWINGKLSDPRYTLGTESKFSQELPELKPGETLTLDLEVDGAVGSKENRSYPAGVAGVFFLEAVPTPVESQPLTHWIASEGIGLKEAPVTDAKELKPAYFETHFQLPEKWPSERLFMESTTHLGWFILNGYMISTPGWMNRIDISGMVKKDGSENTLYWVPRMFEPMRFVSYRIPNTVTPQLNLSWQKKDHDK